MNQMQNQPKVKIRSSPLIPVILLAGAYRFDSAFLWYQVMTSFGLVHWIHITHKPTKRIKFYNSDY